MLIPRAAEAQRSATSIYEWSVKQNLGVGGIVSLRAAINPGAGVNGKIIPASDGGLPGNDCNAVN
jgi:hypothetical protein